MFIEVKALIRNVQTKKSHWIFVPDDEELVDLMEEGFGINESPVKSYIQDVIIKLNDYSYSIKDIAHMKSLKEISKISAALNHDGNGLETNMFVFKEILEKYTQYIDEACDIIEYENYTLHDDCKTLADVAEKDVENGMYSEQELLKYIDYERLGRDLNNGNSTYVETDKGMLQLY